jgi:hypothetical protein
MNKKRGLVSLSRTTTGRYLLLIADEKSNEVCEVEMSAEEFATAITGQQSKCDLRTFTEE